MDRSRRLPSPSPARSSATWRAWACPHGLRPSPHHGQRTSTALLVTDQEVALWPTTNPPQPPRKQVAMPRVNGNRPHHPDRRRFLLAAASLGGVEVAIRFSRVSYGPGPVCTASSPWSRGSIFSTNWRAVSNLRWAGWRRCTGATPCWCWWPEAGTCGCTP